MAHRNLKGLMKLSAMFDSTINFLAILGALILVFLMVSISLSVVMRYFFTRPLIWVIEIAEYCLLYMTLLSSAWLLRGNGHTRIDLLIEWLNPGLQTTVKITTSLLGASLCVALFWYGAEVTWDEYKRALYPSQAVLEIPDAYIMLIIPIAGLMLSVQFMRIAWGVWRSWRASRGQEQKE